MHQGSFPSILIPLRLASHPPQLLLAIFETPFSSLLIINRVKRRSRHRENDMAEEHRCQAPEGHRLCSNNCGFLGSPATMNLCSKCYRDFRLKEQQEASTKSTIEAALTIPAPQPSSTPSALPPIESPPPPPSLTLTEVSVEPPSSASVAAGPDRTTAQPNRCASCRKRVGLTAFKCKCGVTFCGVHRYPEKHGCGFDFKKVGREEIARANPMIKADKLNKI
ncbi:hypothetical protein L6164_033830 [Bauhinia variegata]|uniref:Uncharacterized protein n=1 Tax=Bauhinia variegata TaxID=167791 RepID=A0ACB9KT38_BAUVA|nr:hypothetical protein L6164_033830 [Bauhinia variegata]